jgi:hypothetical protein
MAYSTPLQMATAAKTNVKRSKGRVSQKFKNEITPKIAIAKKSEKCNNKNNGIKIKLLECILILKNKLCTLLDCFPDMCKQAIYKI